MDKHPVHAAAIIVFCVLFAIVTGVGFGAVRWRKADLGHLNEWGLAGRKFGTWLTWFLVGGDIYTAYTFIAVPAALYATGSLGFFAFAYTTLVFPVLFVFGPRLWAVCKAHGYITAADFTRGRFGSDTLALAVALTGILATLPYIGLQLIGLKTVIAAMGIKGDWPIIIAFVILAAYTYQSGLRAPALAAIGVGALVPAAIMAIAASNLFTRNVYKAYVRRQADHREEAAVAKIVSVLVKAGALGFALFVSTKSAIDLQLLGGVWIIQTLPAVFLGLYTRWFHRWALLAGWAVGMATGTIMAASQSFKSAFPLSIGSFKVTMYSAFLAILANLIVTIVLTPVTRRLDRREPVDETSASDYVDLSESTGRQELIPA